MKLILFLIISLAVCKPVTARSIDAVNRVSVSVWDYDYSMSYTTFYTVEGDTLLVKKIGTLIGEQDSIVLKRKISDSEARKLYVFFSSVNLFLLKDKYTNPLVEDGDRKKIVLKQGLRKKIISISNFYQNNVAKLFNVINEMLPSELKIKYSK